MHGLNLHGVQSVKWLHGFKVNEVFAQEGLYNKSRGINKCGEVCPMAVAWLGVFLRKASGKPEGRAEDPASKESPAVSIPTEYSGDWVHQT